MRHVNLPAWHAHRALARAHSWTVARVSFHRDDSSRGKNIGTQPFFFETLMTRTTLLDSILGRPSQTYASSHEGESSWQPSSESSLTKAERPRYLGSVTSPSQRSATRDTLRPPSRSSRTAAAPNAHTLVRDMNTVNPFSHWWENRQHMEKTRPATPSDVHSPFSEQWRRELASRDRPASRQTAATPRLVPRSATPINTSQSCVWVPYTKDESGMDMSEMGIALTQDTTTDLPPLLQGASVIGKGPLRSLAHAEEPITSSTPPPGRAPLPRTVSAASTIPSPSDVGDARDDIDEELINLSHDAALYVAQGDETLEAPAPVPPALKPPLAVSAVQVPSSEVRSKRGAWKKPETRISRPAVAHYAQPVQTSLWPASPKREHLQSLADYRMSSISVSDSLMADLNVEPWILGSELGHANQSELHDTPPIEPDDLEPLQRTPTYHGKPYRSVIDRPRQRGPRPTVMGGIEIAQGQLHAPTPGTTPKRSVSDMPRPTADVPPVPTRIVSDSSIRAETPSTYPASPPAQPALHLPTSQPLAYLQASPGRTDLAAPAMVSETQRALSPRTEAPSKPALSPYATAFVETLPAHAKPPSPTQAPRPPPQPLFQAPTSPSLPYQGPSQPALSSPLQAAPPLPYSGPPSPQRAPSVSYQGPWHPPSAPLPYQRPLPPQGAAVPYQGPSPHLGVPAVLYQGRVSPQGAPPMPYLRTPSPQGAPPVAFPQPAFYARPPMPYQRPPPGMPPMRPAMPWPGMRPMQRPPMPAPMAAAPISPMRASSQPASPVFTAQVPPHAQASPAAPMPRSMSNPAPPVARPHYGRPPVLSASHGPGHNQPAVATMPSPMQPGMKVSPAPRVHAPPRAEHMGRAQSPIESIRVAPAPMVPSAPTAAAPAPTPAPVPPSPLTPPSPMGRVRNVNTSFRRKPTMLTVDVVDGSSDAVSTNGSASGKSGSIARRASRGRTGSTSEGSTGVIVLGSHMSPPRKVSSTGVIVKVMAVAIDNVDRAMVRNVLRDAPSTPFVPGRSFCGRVVDCGLDVKRLRPGDLVFGLQDLRKCGALAEYIMVHQDVVAVAPEGRLVPEQIAALPATGVMVHQIVQHHCMVLPRGSRILVLNAHDMIGLLTMQEASRLGMVIVAQVPQTVPHGEALCRQNGAVEVVTGDPLWTINLLHESSFNLVVDTIGSRHIYDACRRVLANYGQFVTCYGDDNLVASPMYRSHMRSLRRSFFRKDRKAIGYEWIGVDTSTDCRQALESIRTAVQRGAITPQIRAVLPVDMAPEALSEASEPDLVVLRLP